MRAPMTDATSRDPSSSARIALSTAPDAATAEVIASALVARRIAACVNVLPGVTSIYRWKGAVERAAEVLMVIKTASGRLAELEAAIAELHPYEVPELVVLAPERVEAKYLAWIEAETSRG
jgi:periplasmic divalent cation tolerance protein